MSERLQLAVELDYGEIVPGVLCPDCACELMNLSAGAWCDWCGAYVPIVDGCVQFSDRETPEDSEDG